ncbi:MAG TPA: hypothetical protein VFG37_00630 [Planctomycetota bacterium]|nr:hypothetical protein [Planctomycetota bacterium]
MRRVLLRVLCVCAAAGAAGRAAAGQTAADGGALPQIDRKLAKEPKYVAAPRYALFVLDEAGRFKAWAVFDKSSADAPYYDVLYFDKNGDGDLTAPDERFAGVRDAKLADAGLEMLIRVGDVSVPGTTRVHKGLRFATSPKAGRKGFWFDMNWFGATEVSGTYGPVGIDTAEFADSPANAAVVTPDPNGVLAFGLWMAAPVELAIGEATHVSLIAGNPGVGPNALAAVDEKFLDLEKDELIATVVAQDAKGGLVETTTRIRQHC